MMVADCAGLRVSAADAVPDGEQGTGNNAGQGAGRCMAVI